MIKYYTNNIKYNELNITHICKPKLKNSYISVTKDEVILKTPKVSDVFIYELLEKKQHWIRKKIIYLNNKTIVNKEISDEDKAKDYLRKRVEIYSKKMNLSFLELKFRRMKRRWGSCDSKKIITLNIYLYNAPIEQIDYVIVHELAHLIHMNHSKKFHNLVDEYFPNAKEIESNFYLL
ncbi:MAG: M48 family metallopeptidase [Sulfurimonas sp.]|nr:M48 family metallopeptidase [Sulfurimonas sp.]